MSSLWLFANHTNVRSRALGSHVTWRLVGGRPQLCPDRHYECNDNLKGKQSLDTGAGWTLGKVQIQNIIGVYEEFNDG